MTPLLSQSIGKPSRTDMGDAMEMMPILSNPRHEKFAQVLAEGKPATEAYQIAGYAPNYGNCIRLKGNERVGSRVAELQAAGAERAEVTLEGLIAEASEI
jgi:phage terminase small subunit